MRCVVFKMKLLRNKFIVFICIMMTVYLYLFYLLGSVWNIWPLHSALSSVKLPYVIVHLDLKGAPLKLKYLESILPLLKKHGANGLLIEYEDMFPYEGKLVNISSKDCYEKKELKNFLRAAVQLKFEVIPLIQTFGHMEHVLKLQEFMHLREVAKYPDSICPSKMESRALIEHMLEQIINFHFSVIPLNYIHIGCDEVFNMYKCQQCIIKNMPVIDFFANHVRFVADAVTKLSPDTTILIWDDMLRYVNPSNFKYLNPFQNIEPVYWNYRTNKISDVSLFNYHQRFKNIWIASAFKGADGETVSVPSLKNRLWNHFTWMNHILDYKFGGEEKVYKFKGIILTGWSRYSHFDPLTELFPVAIPSLVANLLLIDKYKKGICNKKIISDINKFYASYGLELSKEFSQSLRCGKDITPDVFEATRYDNYLESCDFESQDLFFLICRLDIMKFTVEEAFSKDDDSNVFVPLEYYVKVKFVGVRQQEKSFKWLNDTLTEFYILKKVLAKVMKNYYSNYVVEEYLNYKTYKFINYLEYLVKLLKSVNSIRYWDRNPFNTTI